MAENYQKLAADIIEAVGGKKNIVGLRHCVTRLRFNLRNEKLAKDDVLKNMPGVVTIVKAAGEYMVVIGEHVHLVFVEVCKQLGVEAGDRGKIKLEDIKKNPFTIVLDIVMSAMGPTLNLMCACGILKGLLVVLGMVGLPADSGLYLLLSAAGDSFFYFMPLLLAYNVARKLGIDSVFGFILAAALCYPTIQGVDINLFGLTANATYTGTFLPAVFGVAVAAPIYKFFNKHIPGVVKGFVVPLLTLLVAFPITFMVVGPLANLIGVGINFVLNAVVSFSPPLAGLLLGGAWQTMVLFGVHGIPMMFAFMDLLAGNPSAILALSGGACWAVCGAVLAVYLKSKDKNLKGVSLPAFVSAIFGVTEPSVYGVLLPNINTFVFVSIGAAVGGLTNGLFGVKMYTYAGMGIVGLLGNINPNGGTNFFAIALQAVLPFVIAFVLSFLFFKDKKVPQPAAAAPAPKAAERTPLNKKVTLAAPAAGEVKPLSACSDEAFSGEALGKGCLLLPAGGKIYAPCDATVRRLFPTGHAVGLETAEGVEVLIHIGMDTIKLDGKHFTAHVKQGDAVKKGQLLIEFDKAAIEAAGYKTETPVVITNTDDCLDVIEVAQGETAQGADLLTILL